MANSTPQLDTRNTADVARALATTLPGYVPELHAGSGQAAWAILQVLARYARIVIERLNQAPDKNKLAFLDLMGISLLPPQAARAPVVFQSIPAIGDGHVPARTRVGANPPAGSNPVVFETELDIALAAAKLTDVRTVYPARDSYADHSGAALAGEPFTLFQPLKPIRHELYLSHDTLLRLAGKSTVSIEFDLQKDGDQALHIDWQYWNGEVWQSFELSDATAGLTRSGVVHLSTDCGHEVKRTVHEVEAYWIRGVLTSALAPVAGVALASAGRIQLRSTISRPLPPACQPGIQPDAAVADGTKLDITKTFYPLGRNPDRSSAFYFTSDEVFSKPAGNAQLCFERRHTPEEQADRMAAKQLADQAIALEVKIAAAAGQFAVDAATSLMLAAAVIVDDPPIDPNLIAAAQSNVDALSTAVGGAQDLAGMQALLASLTGTIPSLALLLSGGDSVLGPVVGQLGATANGCVTMLQSCSDLVPVIADVHLPLVEHAVRTAAGALIRLAESLVQALADAPSGHSFGNLAAQIGVMAAALASLQEVAHTGDLIQPATDLANGIGATDPNQLIHFSDLAQLALQAQGDAGFILQWMIDLAQLPENGTINENAPKLDPPQLIWEYWNGERWSTLLKPATAHPNNFLGSGRISFTVPEDFGTCEVAGTKAKWARVRISTGSFNELRYVTWKDQVTNSVTSMAILQPRPPLLEGFYLGYDYKSKQKPAEHCLTLNDFAWDDRTAAAEWPGSPFEPYRPTADRTPAVYLGFDRALPADLLGLFVNIQEDTSVSEGPELNWEYWTGSAWQKLGAADETRRLALPGLVTAVWPGPSAPPLARFGTDRTWIRASLDTDTKPIESRVLGLYLNAVWAVNLQTVQNETLGSSNGQERQSLYFRQTPVLEGETFEVRELQGPRAEVELTGLRQDLIAQGLSDSDIRIVRAVKTGAVTEVWVRWRVEPHLLFSGPTGRDATIERATGRLIFGDGENGMIPAAGQDNVSAPLYRFGGGPQGNVPARAVTQLLSGITAQGVSNPRPGEGGANGETTAQVLRRGPRVMRHRYRAVTVEDYEDLACEASRGVAAARALPARHPNGRPAPGWVTVVIVPQSADPRPQPSFELRNQVQQYLAARAPATVAGIGVLGPHYLPVGVNAVLTPLQPGEAKAVADAAAAALAAFLQPLTGGPAGAGWPFGRGVYLSDVASLLESVAGVDYVSHLELLLHGTPWGDFVPVGEDRIVAAGPIQISLQGGEQ